LRQERNEVVLRRPGGENRLFGEKNRKMPRGERLN